MAVIPIPTIEPVQFTAGDTVKWNPQPANYPPSDGWSLAYWIFGAVTAAAKYGPFSATPNVSDFSMVLATTDTAKIPFDDDYFLSGFVTRTSPAAERYCIYRNRLNVLPDPTILSSSLDNRSHAKRCLDALNAVMEGRATRDEANYSIQGRSVGKIPHAELMKLRDYYASLVQTEEMQYAIDRGMGTKKNVRVRFNSTGRTQLAGRYDPARTGFP